MDKLDLEAIDYIMASSKLKFSTRSFIYTFTNECIKDYLKFFDLKSKEILTVTGSGDHILNMLLDVDNIDTFDINLYAYYFYILKSYSLITLELDEYLDFFLDKESNYSKRLNKIGIIILMLNIFLIMYLQNMINIHPFLQIINIVIGNNL